MVLHESHAKGAAAPEKCDCCDMNTGAESTDDNGGWGLKEDVSDEEDQVGDVLNCVRVKGKS